MDPWSDDRARRDEHRIGVVSEMPPDEPLTVASRLGLRVRAQVLITRTDGKVLAVGEPAALPGEPLGDRRSLIAAAREGVEKDVPIVALIGEPLVLTVDRPHGVTVVFDGLRSAETLPTDAVETGWRWAEPSAVPGVEEALAARAAGRTRYREDLCWPLSERRDGGATAPYLGALLSTIRDNDVVEWVLGVILGAFPVDTTFMSVRGLWWAMQDDPDKDVVGALHRILMALAEAGVIDEVDETEISWSARVEVTSG
jgi:hypothetical protein